MARSRSLVVLGGDYMSVYVHGIFNAKKCITYLRSIGAEISDELAQSFLDAENVHRFCKSMKRPQREAWLWECRSGHYTLIVRKRGQRRTKNNLGDTSKEPKCAECGGALVSGRTWWVETRDGVLKDYRPKDERWRALEDVDSL